MLAGWPSWGQLAAIVIYDGLVVAGGMWWLVYTDRHAPPPGPSIWDEPEEPAEG